MSGELGNGPHLDGDFDFAIDPSGDLKGDEGIDELQKDLAFQMVINLSRYLGQPPTGNLDAKVAGTARRVLRLDSRIDYVRDDLTEVSFSGDREEITLKMTAKTVDGEQDLIFDI